MYTNVAYLYPIGKHQNVVDTSVPLLVTGCGYYRVDSGRVATERPNGRQDYQLLYILSGKARFWCKDSMRTLGKGNMVLYRPDERQMYYYYGKDAPEVYFVHFTGAEVARILDVYGVPDTSGVLSVSLSADYQRLFVQMLQELQLRREGYIELTEMYLRQIFLMLRRYISEGQRANGYITDEMERAMHYFNKNYSRQISIAQYARDCHMSECWFINSFKAFAKMTPMQYIVSVRMTNAMNFLEHTEYSISEIASMVGYDNALYFSRLFHKRIGMSPSEYRRSKIQ